MSQEMAPRLIKVSYKNLFWCVMEYIILSMSIFISCNQILIVMYIYTVYIWSSLYLYWCTLHLYTEKTNN